MERGNIFIGIIIGLLIAGGLLGAYYLGMKKAAVPSQLNGNTQPASITPQQVINSPTSSATPDETANWKIYTNKQLNFSFQYPDSYKFEKEDDKKIVFSGVFGPRNQIISSELVVNVYPTLDLKTLNNCKNAQFQENPPITCLDGDVITKNINGIQMNVFHIAVGLNNTQSMSSYVYQMIDNPKIEFIHQILGGGVEPRFDQILSTFKFTNQTSPIPDNQLTVCKTDSDCSNGNTCQYVTSCDSGKNCSSGYKCLIPKTN